MVRRDQGVAFGGALAEPGADSEDQVGAADTLQALRVGAIAEVAGMAGAAVGDRVLAAEGGGYGDAMAPGEIGEMMRRAGAPVRTADDGDRISRFLEQLERSLDGARVGAFGDWRHGRAVERLDFV